MSFTELSICGFAKNITSISPQLALGSLIAIFDKTQFFFETPCIFHFTMYMPSTHLIHQKITLLV